MVPKELLMTRSTFAFQHQNSTPFQHYRLKLPVTRPLNPLHNRAYRIRLEGNDDDYATVWSTLIGQTARTKEHMFTIALDSPFPYYPNEPISIEVISSGDEPSVYSRNSLLPLSEDVMVDDLWRGKTWADQAGWHQFLVKEDSTTLNYLVSANGEWNTLRTTNQIKLNELAQKSTGSSPERAKHYESTEIPDLVFFLTFLISSAFLWLAPKI